MASKKIEIDCSADARIATNSILGILYGFERQLQRSEPDITARTRDVLNIATTAVDMLFTVLTEIERAETIYTESDGYIQVIQSHHLLNVLNIKSAALVK